MTNVIDFRRVLDGALDPEIILNRAMEADLETVVVIGWTKEGQAWAGSSTSDGGDVLWLAEILKKAVLE